MAKLEPDRLVMAIADTLEEAREKLRRNLPAGAELVSERILCDGRPQNLTACADTTEKALEKARRQIDREAVILEEKVLTAPERKVVLIEAFDQPSAAASAARQAQNLLPGSNTTVRSLERVAAGSRGVLGMGKRPDRYEAVLLRQAEVAITYQGRVKITARLRDVGALVACLKDEDAARRREAVGALDSFGWQPPQDEDGARYWIEKGQWETCAAIGKPAVEMLLARLEGADRFERRDAAMALTRIDDPRPVQPLLKALQADGLRWQDKGAIAAWLAQHGVRLEEPRLQETLQELVAWTSRADELTDGFDGDWKKIDYQESYDDPREEAAALLERIVAYAVSLGKTDRLAGLEGQAHAQGLLQCLEQDLGWRIRGQIAVLLVRQGMRREDAHLQASLQELERWANMPDATLESDDAYIHRSGSYAAHRAVARGMLDELT